MRSIYRMTLIFLGCTFLICFSTHLAVAQNFATVVPMEEETASQDNLTKEQLAQPIPVDEIQLGEDQNNLDYIDPSDYTLGFQDIIEVTVLRHPEVSGQYSINAEGSIQYEFVGDIKITGMKKDKVKEVLTEKLSYYIINPDVTVKIIGFNSKIVYVVGEVSSPGKIFMHGDTITVREALVQAGLPLLSGKLKSAKVITPADSGKANVKRVNIHKLLYEGDLRENIVMQPGDTLYIPPTFLAKTMRVISPVTAPISSTGGAASSARRIYTGGF